ncbi:CBS domain-containing protein [Geodermatophilus telluris]|uniref:CBS domain-containing protein n=1 Tax=Geodermatophilus telluris TaxID=1190417 RepID=A0A1G6QHR3_9ACTN|nr:CBS domain-containing protein [Geodermatophilus telluris]SDC91919.1 CBS domain-containing protein [Geodermatophilus telluris]
MATGPVAAHRLPVHELLRSRPGPRVRGEDDVAEVARTMLTSRETAVPVVGGDGRLLGLVTAWHCVELVAGARDRDRRREPPTSQDAGDVPRDRG